MSGILLIVRRSLRQHLLSTLITVFCVALGIGLVMAVFSVSAQARHAFTGGPAGFDAVLGARGSQLQLVLNSVFHLETSPGNIPWSVYQEVKRTRGVELAVPYAVGDNYHGYRIVGTTTEMFTDFEYREGKKFEVQPGGFVFDPERRQAVIGSTVAAETDLQLGSVFSPYHGLDFDPAQEHAEEYVVVGVLEPTSSPSDRVIWIPIEGIFRMEGHVLKGSGEVYEAKANEAIPDEHKEVSAVMLKLGNPRVGLMLNQRVNMQGKSATLAWPIGKVMAELFDKMGWVVRVLEAVAYLVVLVASASILASLYNTMNERRREFAILRSLGAGRGTIWSAIVLEAGIIAFLGSLAGYLVYGGILGVAGMVIRSQTGVVLEALTPHPVLWWAPVGMTLLGAASGLLPAFKAYRTDVADNLQPTS